MDFIRIAEGAGGALGGAVVATIMSWVANKEKFKANDERFEVVKREMQDWKSDCEKCQDRLGTFKNDVTLHHIDDRRHITPAFTEMVASNHRDISMRLESMERFLREGR